MKLTVQQFRYLLKTAETGSISDAAKELESSRGAVSMAIGQIEKEIGFPVFERSKRGVTPTERGTEVLARARRVVDDMDLFERLFETSDAPKSRFSVSTRAYKFAIAAFNKVANTLDPDQYDYALNLQQFTKPIDDVRAGISNIGVIHLSPNDRGVMLHETEAAGLEFHPLFKTRQYAYLDHTHPFANRKSATLEELNSYPEFSFERYRYLMSAGKAQTVSYSNAHGRSTMAPDDLMQPDLIASIADINGFALWFNLFPDHKPYTSTRIVPVDTDDKWELGYVMRKGARPNEVEAAFIETLHAYDPER